jgi:hypothetical protein
LRLRAKLAGDKAGAANDYEFQTDFLKRLPGDRSSIYLDALPLFTSGEVALLDNRRLVAELVGLERRVSIAGRDAINHVRGAHDDLANACCGAWLRRWASGSRCGLVLRRWS